MISPISAEAFPTNKNRPCLNPTEAPVQQHRKGQTLLTPHPCCGGRSCSGWPWNISRCTRSRLTVDNQGLWSLHHFGFHVWNDKSKFLLDLNNTRFLSCLELESRSNMLRHLTVALPWLQPPRRPLAWNALQPASSETYQRITESQLILGPSPQKKTWPSPLICIILEAAVQFHNGPCSLSADPGRHTSTNIEADTRKCDIGFSHWTLSWYRGAGKSNSWTLE